MEVDVVKAVRVPVPADFIRRVLRQASRLPEIAARMPGGKATVAVRLTDDSEMRKLNSGFAGEDHATDVLSFGGHGEHLGDIAISWPAVERQARDFDYPPQSELALLCVHGLLHLLGWDHHEEKEAREMWRVQAAGLGRAGVRLPARRL